MQLGNILPSEGYAVIFHQSIPVKSPEKLDHHARAQLFLEQGQALIRKGQGFYGLAHENLEKSLNFDPENYETLCTISSVLISAENPKSDLRLGKKYLEQAIAINPDLPSAYFNLANLLSIKVSNPEKDYKRAVACYLKA